MLEEHGIKLFPKAVDVEVLEGVLRALEQARLQVAESRDNRRAEAHVRERLRLQRDRVVVELLVIEDAAHAVPAEHHAVFLLRVRAAGGQRRFPVQKDVVIGGRALPREHVVPPLIDFRHLGKEPVSAHIHAVSVVFDRAGDAAELAALLKDGHFILIRLREQLVRCRKARRACADDQGFLLHMLPRGTYDY